VDNLVSKEYKGNSAKISRIYILVTTNIYHIFLSLQVETVTVCIRALVQEWKK